MMLKYMMTICSKWNHANFKKLYLFKTCYTQSVFGHRTLNEWYLLTAQICQHTCWGRWSWRPRVWWEASWRKQPCAGAAGSSRREWTAVDCIPPHTQPCCNIYIGLWVIIFLLTLNHAAIFTLAYIPPHTQPCCNIYISSWVTEKNSFAKPAWFCHTKMSLLTW